MNIYKYIIVLLITAFCIGCFATRAEILQPSFDKHPEWNEQDRLSILEGRVWVGMSKEQVVLSWGYPYKNSRLDVGYGALDTWTYMESYWFDQFRSYKFIYFKNDIVTGISR